MAATLTGTVTTVTWASGINPAGQSITIPADATAVYMFWTFFNATDGSGLSSVTLNGNNPSQTSELPTGGGGNYTATGVAAWYNPSTGSRTLDVEWDASPTEGPTTIVAYVKDGDTNSWRSVGSDQDASGAQVTTTISTVSGDLVLKYDQRASANSDEGIGPPTASIGWDSIQTIDNNQGEGVRLSSISATGTTQVCNSESEYYSTIIAIAIPPASAGSNPSTSYYYRMLNG